MLAGLYAAALAQGLALAPVPRGTALGSLVNYITRADVKHFQPANITFDLLQPLEEEIAAEDPRQAGAPRLQCERALAAFDAWWSEQAAAVRRSEGLAPTKVTNVRYVMGHIIYVTLHCYDDANRRAARCERSVPASGAGMRHVRVPLFCLLCPLSDCAGDGLRLHGERRRRSTDRGTFTIGADSAVTIAQGSSTDIHGDAGQRESIRGIDSGFGERAADAA